MRALALIACLIATPAMAHDPWTLTDIAFEATYMVVDGADWLQTRQIALHLDCSRAYPCWYERNKILGRHPSLGRVNLWFVAGDLTHPIVSYLLPQPWRRIWQASGIGLEFFVVRDNMRIGLQARF